MAKLMYELNGVRGRRMKLYDTKCVINTDKTVGSFLSGNFTDGEKTIFLKDVVGVQFKRSGMAIGYLQFETPSMQMNNGKDNMFSENTFTFEDNKNDVTNDLVEEVYNYVVDRIEELKYGIVATQPPAPVSSSIQTRIPNIAGGNIQSRKPDMVEEPVITDEPIVPPAAEGGMIMCPVCKTVQNARRKVCWHCSQKFLTE